MPSEATLSNARHVCVTRTTRVTRLCDALRDARHTHERIVCVTRVDEGHVRAMGGLCVLRGVTRGRPSSSAHAPRA